MDKVSKHHPLFFVKINLLYVNFNSLKYILTYFILNFLSYYHIQLFNFYDCVSLYRLNEKGLTPSIMVSNTYSYKSVFIHSNR